MPAKNTRVTLELSQAEVDMIQRALERVVAGRATTARALHATAAEKENAHRDALLAEDILTQLATGDSDPKGQT